VLGDDKQQPRRDKRDTSGNLHQKERLLAASRKHKRRILSETLTTLSLTRVRPCYTESGQKVVHLIRAKNQAACLGKPLQPAEYSTFAAPCPEVLLCLV